MRALVYNAQGDTKLYSLQRVMTEMILPNTGITFEIVTAENIIERLGPDVVMLLLPGARASTGYRTQLCGPRFDAIMNAMDRGMQVMGICAGGYVLCRDFQYDDYDPVTGRLNETRHISSALGIVDAKAWGPDQRLYTPRQRVEGDPWSVFNAVALRFSANGQPFEATVAISKAPSFIEYNATQCTPMAHYTDTGDVAMLRFRFGQGGGILSGPGIEVGGANLKHYVHPRHAEDEYAKGVIKRLNDSHQQWHQLLAETFTTLVPGEPKIHRQIRQNLGLT